MEQFLAPQVNEWGEMLYMPTRLGEAVLTTMVAVMLLFAMVFIQHRGIRVSAKKMGFCAMTIGVATLFSNITLYSFDTGGAVTFFSMFVIFLPAYWYGMGAGIMTGMAYGIFQMLVDPYMLFPTQIVVDYLLAIGALGIGGLFCNRKYGVITGYFTSVVGRYIFATLSGWIFFGDYAWEGWSALSYSMAYNAIYIFAEAGITLVILFIPPVRKLLYKLKQIALEQPAGNKRADSAIDLFEEEMESYKA